MIPPYQYALNLNLVQKFRHVEGAVVECGVWRGGMIGGVAKLLGNTRKYYLYDSFEGLPPAQAIDGESAFWWQANKDSPEYYDNCSAEESFAWEAMRLAGVDKFHIVKGWFNETLPQFDAETNIAILRIDGDWYESTMQCFENLYDKVVEGGLIILDDYHTWDGCTRAVHDYLSQFNLTSRIRQCNNTVGYIVKSENPILVA